MRISGGIAAALCVAATLSASGALANGRYPASTQIVFSTDAADPDLVVVRTTYGLLLSRDRGATWRWLCESALGVPSVSIEDPSVALTASDTLVVGLVEGLEVSQDSWGGLADDLGCSFGCAAGPLASQPIVDLAATPGATHAVLALSSSVVFNDAGKTPSLDTRVWQTLDDGAHWAQRGAAIDPTVTVTTVDVAATDPARLYVSGTRGFGATRIASLFVSTDGGDTWIERPLPFNPATEVSVFIGAVDPGNADRVYLRTSGASRLLVTSDAGRTFQAPLAMTGQMLGFAVTADGAKVYAGSIEDGLFVAGGAGASADASAGAGALDLAFHKVSSIHVQCLATRGDELWACSDEASGFSVGVSTDDGAHFAPRFQPARLAGPVACGPSSQGPLACGADANASQCSGAAFDALCATLGCNADAAGGVSVGADVRAGTDALEAGAGGAPSLTADASVDNVRAPNVSCGCSMVPARGSSGIGAACAFAAVFARRRRRRSDASSARPRDAHVPLLPRDATMRRDAQSSCFGRGDRRGTPPECPGCRQRSLSGFQSDGVLVE